MDRDRQPSPSSTARRSFFPGISKRTTSDDSSEDIKGRLGLITLYNPPEGIEVPDLVFVHGLRGGSRKTWIKSNDATLFWPKE